MYSSLRTVHGGSRTLHNTVPYQFNPPQEQLVTSVQSMPGSAKSQRLQWLKYFVQKIKQMVN